MFTLEGVHKRQSLYKVLIHSQRNLETSNMETTTHPETSQVPHLVVKPGKVT